MYVVITLVIIGLLAIIFNAIFNKKDKIAEKLKLEKKEIKKCPQCYKEYVDLKKKNVQTVAQN